MIQSRIITFRGDFSIGTLSLRASGSTEKWTDFGEAIGNVVIPLGQEVRLEVFPTVLLEKQTLSGLEPDALSEFQWVSTSKVTDAAIANLRHLTGLKGLALWETNIGDEALQHVRHLCNLSWLDIGDTKITDAGLGYLRELSCLNDLALLNDRISNYGLIHLQNLLKLEGLDLMNTPLTDEGAGMLCNMSRLKNLRIFNTCITEEGYQKLKAALPRCRIKYYHPQNA